MKVGIKIGIVVGSISLVGTFIAAYAATNIFHSSESESGVRNGNVAVVSDTSASAHSVIRFGTASSLQTNCIVVPSTCGYPDATNTGVPSGTTLTRVPQDATSGPCWTYRADIQAIETACTGMTLKDIRMSQGMIIVRHGSVTLRNIHISTNNMYPIDCDYGGDTRAAGSCLGLTIEDSEVEGLSANCLVSIAFNGYTARRVHAHGCQDGFKADANVLIEDSYVHDLAYRPESSPGANDDSHNDAVQTTGGSNVVLRHNTLKLSTTTNASSVVQFGTEWGTPNSHWTIENNLLDGAGWVLNANAPINNMIITGNRFTRNHLFGIGYIAAAVYTNNIYDNDLSPVTNLGAGS